MQSGGGGGNEDGGDFSGIGGAYGQSLVGSDENTQSEVASISGMTRKKKRGVPPSRLPGAVETRNALIPKRNKKNTSGL